MSKWSRVEVPFGGGMDQKARPEALPATSFVLLQNLVQNRSGSYTKPPGYVNLPNTIDAGGTIAAGAAAFTYRDAPVLIDGAKAYSFSTAEQAWHSLGVAAVPSLARFQGIAVQSNPTSAWDICYCNGYYVIASAPPVIGGNVSGPVTVSVIDAATGVRAAADAQVTHGSTNAYVRCVPMGTKVVLFYWDFALGADLFYCVLDASSATAIYSGPTSLAQLPNATDLVQVTSKVYWDVTASAGNSTIYVAYANAGGTVNCVTVRSYTLSGTTLAQVTSTTVNTSSTTTPKAIGIGGDSTDRIWVAYQAAAANGFHVTGLDPTALTVNATDGLVILANATGTGPSVSVLGLGSGNGHLMVSNGSEGMYFRNFTTSAGAVSVASTTTRRYMRAQAVSRQWVTGGRVYAAWMLYDFNATTLQGQTLIVDITDAATDPLDSAGHRWPRPVGTFAPGLTSPAGQGLPGTPPHVAVNGSVFGVPQLVNKSSLGVSNGGVSTLDIFVADFASTKRWKAASVGEAVMLGGAPQYCDGSEVAEVGFVAYPEVTGVAALAGTALTAGASYTYQAIYEYTDGSGCVAWSAPSLASAAYVPAAGANQDATVTVTCLQISGKRQPINVAIYRSKNGAPYQRIGTVANDITQTTGTVQFADHVADNTLGTANPYIYTTGGAQPRLPPPSLYALTAHGDRIYGVDPTGKGVWYTGQYVYGEAPWFTSLFQFPVDAGGPIVGIGSMDGRTYYFKRDRIFVVDGDGPPDAGGGGYSLPAEIPCGGAGCIDARSIVTTPTGIFYQSDQGIYLLTRGNEVQYIGRAVETTVKTYGPVTSATLNAPAGRVVFTLNSASPNPTAVFYDYVHGIWSQRLGVMQYPFVAATMVGGQLTTDGASNVPVWTGAIANGFVYQESSSTFLDGGGVGSWQPSTLQTSWIKLDGQQSFSRIRELGLLAEYVSDHKLTINVFFDYSASAPQVITFSAAQIDAFTTAREQLAIRLKTQKVEAVQVQIVDAADGTTGSVGQGCNFIGLAFTVAPKSGGYRLPVNQRA